MEFHIVHLAALSARQHPLQRIAFGGSFLLVVKIGLNFTRLQSISLRKVVFVVPELAGLHGWHQRPPKHARLSRQVRPAMRPCVGL